MTQDDDLAARVRRLELIELAKAATVEYGRACDRKDVGALRTDVFADDVVLHLPGRDVNGPEDVAAFYTGAFGAEPGTRRHFVTNQLASVDRDGRVVVDSYFLFLSADARSVIGWGAYRDVVVVGDDGEARIADKTIVVDVHTDVTRGWAMEPAT
jgi:ketosteroid isomerase-like protein